MQTSVWLVFFVLGLLALIQLGRIARSLESTARSLETRSLETRSLESRSLESKAAMTKRLLAHRGVESETDVEPSAKVRELAVDRKTYVDAIRAYRQQTGLDLREAKAFVDALARPRRGSA